MADGKIVVKAEVDAKNAQKELDKLTAKIDKMEADLKKSTGEQSGIKAQLDAAKESAKQTETAIKSLKSEAEQLRRITSGEVSASPEAYISAYGRQSEVAAQLKEQEAALRQQDEVVESLDGKYAKITDKVNEQTAALDAAKTKAGELAKEITSASGASERMELAAKKVSDSMNTFSKRIGGLFKRILVFSLITRALQSLRTWLGKTIMQNEEARAAVARLKAALLTLAQPILQVVIPVFVKLVNILTQVVAMVAEFISILTGSSFAASKDAAKSLNDEKKALNGVGAAAKSAEKSMAGFDEINKLTANNASGGGASSGISAEFDSLSSALPAWLANLAKALHDFAGDVAIKIRELKFDWEEGNILKNKDAWIIALSGILGAVIGSAFGGLTGGVIGLLLGVAIGIIGVTWTDKLENPSKAKNLAIAVLSGIIGAVLGTMFGGLAGGVIGLLLGVSIGIVAVQFTDDKFSDWTSEDTFNTVMTAILGAILGAAFGGLTGAVLGLLFGVTISLIAISFKDKLKEIGSSTNGFFDLLNILLGVIIGAQFGGLAGGIIGLVLGLSISLARIAFSDEVSAGERKLAQSGLKIILTTLIFALIGAACGFGPLGAIVGGVIGLVAGILIQLQEISFDDSLSEKEKQKAAGILKTVLYGIIGALIGAAIGGIFGGIVGGIVGISLGLAIHWSSITYDAVPNRTAGSGFSGGGGFGSRTSRASFQSLQVPPISAVEPPRLATGAVIPPNREFLAVLGDQRSGTNIEAPADMIRQMVADGIRAAGGGVNGARPQTVILQVDRRELGRVVYKLNNEETQRVGVRLAGVKA